MYRSVVSSVHLVQAYAYEYYNSNNNNISTVLLLDQITLLVLRHMLQASCVDY